MQTYLNVLLFLKNIVQPRAYRLVSSKSYLGQSPHVVYIVIVHSPFVPPVSRNDIIERITPNISIFINVCTLPVLGSGRRSSRVLPRDITISCCLVPEKLPCTAWVMAVEPCKVKL